MAGKIGRELKKLSNGTLSIPQIYALDPAGMLSPVKKIKFRNFLL